MWWICSRNSEDARAQSLGVVGDPIAPEVQPVDLAHALVKPGPDWTKGIRKQHLTVLARGASLAVRVADPGGLMAADRPRPVADSCGQVVETPVDCLGKGWTVSHRAGRVDAMDGELGTVQIDAIGQDEGAQILDATARRLLHMSGAEFVERWNRGDTDDMDHVAAMKVAMLIPLAG